MCIPRFDCCWNSVRRSAIWRASVAAGASYTTVTRSSICICVPSTVTARIQEVHLTIGHLLCALVEDALLAKRP